MILSNQGGDQELHQRAIVTMGDTLGKQRPAPSLPPLYGSPRSSTSCAEFSGSVQGPGPYLQLASDPGASVVWGQKLQGKECPSCLPVSQNSCGKPGQGRLQPGVLLL